MQTVRNVSRMLNLANAARLKEYLRPLVRGERDDRATVPDATAKAAWPGDPTGASQRKRLRRDAVRRLMLAFYWPLERWALSALTPSGSGTSALVLMALVARETVSINPRLT